MLFSTPEVLLSSSSYLDEPLLFNSNVKYHVQAGRKTIFAKASKQQKIEMDKTKIVYLTK